MERYSYHFGGTLPTDRYSYVQMERGAGAHHGYLVGRQHFDALARSWYATVSAWSPTALQPARRPSRRSSR